MALGNGGGRILTAEFDSECGECFEPVEAGDSIENREGHWCHAECPSTPRGPNAARWDGTDDETMGY
jgi:hypothetical protein